MRTGLIATVALLLGLAAGLFLGPLLRPVHAPGASLPGVANQPNSQGSDFVPREDFVNYLDGKAFTIPNQAPGDSNAPLVFKKNQISTLEIEHKAARIGDVPWTGTVHFIVDSDRGKYAVTCSINYQWIEGKCAFFGYQVVRAAKQ